ncbi:MAG TPA: hypothetical protein VJ836_05995 [Candidatus Saccharimonadales bacterium]|nr:hypothetical protein [Candidatus Saccharimonadales bacterium]
MLEVSKNAKKAFSILGSALGAVAATAYLATDAIEYHYDTKVDTAAELSVSPEARAYNNGKKPPTKQAKINPLFLLWEL